MSWQNNAPCKGLTHLFFSNRPSQRAKAHAICKTCTYKDLCYEEAIALTKKHQLFGIWADTTQQQREQIAGRKGFNWYDPEKWW
jgi:hypothetical protein